MNDYMSPTDRANHVFERLLNGETFSTADLADDYYIAKGYVGPLVRRVRTQAYEAGFNLCTTSRGRIPGHYHLSQIWSPSEEDLGTSEWWAAQARSALTHSKTSHAALAVCYDNHPNKRTNEAKMLNAARASTEATVAQLEALLITTGFDDEVCVTV